MWKRIFVVDECNLKWKSDFKPRLILFLGTGISLISCVSDFQINLDLFIYLLTRPCTFLCNGKGDCCTLEHYYISDWLGYLEITM